jgi:hypothetical protein
MSKPSLLNEIAVINNARYVPVCGYQTLLNTLDKPDQIDLEAAMSDFGIQCSAIERALRQRGNNITATTLRRHRRGDCACGRTS